MEPIKSMLKRFEEKHPDLMWYVSRLIITILVINLCIYGFGAFLLSIYPFVVILTGSSIIWFLLWFLLPMPVFVCWVLLEFIKMIYCDYVDIE